MELDKVIKERHSVRKFTTKKPNWRDIIECIDMARYAPMAGKNFTLKFVLISDKAKIGKISEAAQQDFINQAHYLVVVCSDTSRLTNSFGERGEIYAKQQAGAAIQNFLLKITEKKLSTCWVGHFEESQIKKIVGISKDVDIEAIFPIGYEFGKNSPSKKIELDRILYFEKYGNIKMKEIKTLDV